LIASLGAINQTLQNANGVGYQPNADFFGTDYVTVTVDDLGRTGSPGKQITRQSLTLTVTPVNDAPVAHGDPGPGAPQLTVSKSQVLIGSGRGVLANDTDVDGDSLTVVDADNNADPIYYQGRRPGGRRCAGQRGQLHLRPDAGAGLPAAPRGRVAGGHVHLSGQRRHGRL
jgi:hypothetical protein